jgi:hypothetical protein
MSFFAENFLATVMLIDRLVNISLLPSPKDLVPQKHGGEKTTGFSKTTQPIRFLDSSNCAQIFSE